jgi:hypothetical protein
MAKQRLFPEPHKHSNDDSAETYQNFENLATKIFTVPKSEIDKREKQWRKGKNQ